MSSAVCRYMRTAKGVAAAKTMTSKPKAAHGTGLGDLDYSAVIAHVRGHEAGG